MRAIVPHDEGEFPAKVYEGDEPLLEDLVHGLWVGETSYNARLWVREPVLLGRPFRVQADVGRVDPALRWIEQAELRGGVQRANVGVSCKHLRRN